MLSQKRHIALALSVPAVLALSACGSSKDTSSSSVGSGASASPSPLLSPSPDATQPSAAADSATDSGAAPSVAPLGSSALPGVPAVTANATDVTKEPKVAAGTGTASSGLVTRDLVVGSGTAAVASDSVNVQYEGALFSDGSVFDASWLHGGTPVCFPLSGVVPGFSQGIVGMKTGGRREIVIPPALGYMDADQPGIPANSTLTFVVDLSSIQNGACP